jgi:hypothetical protein
MPIATDGTVDKMPPPCHRWLTRERVIVYSASLLASQLILIGVWAVAHWVLNINSVPPLGVDFRVYWSASFVSLHDSAIEAFDPRQLHAIETKLLADTPSDVGYAPWVYPPTFQLLICPLALLPYLPSYALFACVGIACCLVACAPAVKAGALPWIFVIAFPGIWVATVCGQNSLLTLALAAGALGLLERRPLLSGVCAGMLVIKPQLAVLFPLMFLCGRHFRALAAMAATGGLFCAASGLLMGLPLWLKFFEVLSLFNTVVVQNGEGDIWKAMPTVFALARRLGASLPAAYVLHAAVAVSAILATAILWARRARLEVRSAAAVVTTLLAQPYLVYYDLAWLILPIIYLCVDRARWGDGTLVEGVIIAFAWLLPIPSFLAIFKPSMGQWGVVLLPILLVVLLRRAQLHRSCSASF